MNKKVSVIIPNYNYARFLQRRIDCIVSQTIKPAEIIFLDDCSTDNSLEVAQEILSKTDVPYRIIPNEVNQGVFKQWLKGIELTQNDYFWIAEADDYCELNFMETLLPAFDDPDVVIVNCESLIVDLESVLVNTSIGVKSEALGNLDYWSKDYMINQNEMIVNNLSLDNSIYNVSSVLFNRKLINSYDISSVSKFQICGDWLFYIICLNSQETNKISHLSKCLNYHVIHTKSVFGGLSENKGYSVESLMIFNYILNSFSINMLRKHEILTRLLNIFLNYNFDLQVEALLKEISINYNNGFFIEIHKLFKDKLDAVNWLKGQVENYKLALSQKEDGIKWLEGQVENYKLALSQKEDGIKWLEGQVENYKLALSQKEDGIKWLEGQVENYKLALSQKEDGIKSLECQVENYKLDGIKQRLELEMIYSSFSWRFTKLFRFFRKYLNN